MGNVGNIQHQALWRCQPLKAKPDTGRHGEACVAINANLLDTKFITTIQTKHKPHLPHGYDDIHRHPRMSLPSLDGTRSYPGKVGLTKTGIARIALLHGVAAGAIKAWKRHTR